MKKNFIYIAISLIEVILLSELFYFLNFSNYSFNLLKIFNSKMMNYIFKFIIYLVVIFVITFIVEKKSKYRDLKRIIYVFSVLNFLLYMTIMIIYFQNNIDLQTILSSIFLSIFNSYSIFYSIFYKNIVK